MSRRRRRVREAGPVRKTLEVVVSALFGMAVVGVVLLLLQGGATPAATGPQPEASAAGQGQPGAVAGLDGGLGIHSAAPGTPSLGGTLVYSAVPAPGASTPPAQLASPAQAGGSERPAGSASPGASAGHGTGSGGGGSTGTAAATSGATPSPSSTADSGLLGGIVGGVGALVGGVLGLL